jgi:hypothetical protein
MTFKNTRAREKYIFLHFFIFRYEFENHRVVDESINYFIPQIIIFHLKDVLINTRSVRVKKYTLSLS